MRDKHKDGKKKTKFKLWGRNGSTGMPQLTGINQTNNAEHRKSSQDEIFPGETNFKHWDVVMIGWRWGSIKGDAPPEHKSKWGCDAVSLYESNITIRTLVIAKLPFIVYLHFVCVFQSFWHRQCNAPFFVDVWVILSIYVWTMVCACNTMKFFPVVFSVVVLSKLR